MLSEHEERQRRTFSGSVVDQGLNSEFEKLVRLISRDSDMQSALAKASESKQGSFRLSWRPLGTRFPNLLRFAAGLATVMSGTATVEADFSIINYERNSYRSALTNFSLEGILHSRQLEKLRQTFNEMAIDDSNNLATAS